MSSSTRSFHTAYEHLPLDSEGDAYRAPKMHPPNTSMDWEPIVGPPPSPCSSISSTSSKSSIAEYTPRDHAKLAADCQAKALWIEQYLVGDGNPATRHHRLQLLKESDLQDLTIHDWHAYLYDHPEDCPDTPEQIQQQEEKLRAYEEYGEQNGEPYHMETRWQEVFGEWSWPTGEGEGNWQVTVGPKDEEVYLRAVLPDLSPADTTSDDNAAVATPSSRHSQGSLRGSISTITDSVTGLCRRLSRLVIGSPKGSRTA